MPDLIRRSDVIGLLEDMLLFGEYDIIASSFSKADEEKAYRAINDIPTVNRWIPCSERMPENDAKCLVYTSDKRICMARWYGKYDEQGAWYIISDDVPKLYRIKNVPFWMPLPEPPKEAEKR